MWFPFSFFPVPEEGAQFLLGSLISASPLGSSAAGPLFGPFFTLCAQKRWIKTKKKKKNNRGNFMKCQENLILREEAPGRERKTSCPYLLKNTPILQLQKIFCEQIHEGKDSGLPRERSESKQGFNNSLLCSSEGRKQQIQTPRMYPSQG